MSEGWGVIGFGRAGRARVLSLFSLGLKVQGVASKRPDVVKEWLDQRSELECQAIEIYEDWHTLISSSNIVGVFVCSESQSHSQQVHESISQGKHVCVEFPLCSTVEEAHALFALAKQKNVVLHVECIGILTERHQYLKGLVHQSRLDHLSIDFTGGLYRWVEEAADTGQVASLAFGRLHQLIDMFDSLTLCDRQINIVKAEGSVDSYSLQLTFKGHRSTSSIQTSVTINLKESRMIGGKRSSVMKAFYQGQSVVLPTSQKGTLFEKDTQIFQSIVLAHQNQSDSYSNHSTYTDSSSIIETLQLIELIQQNDHSLRSVNIVHKHR
jgi:predicted dehydrogenase